MKNKLFLSVFALAVAGLTGAGSIYASVHKEEISAMKREALQVLGMHDEDEARMQVQDESTAPQQQEIAAREEQNTSESDVRGESRRAGDDMDEEGEDNEREGDDDDSRAVSNQTVPPASTQTPPSSSVKTFTMAQVAVHKTKTDCYTAIGGVVYDLTPFISSHPGGVSAISSLCGIEGTAVFTAQHGGQGNPAQELATLKIGTLVQ